MPFILYALQCRIKYFWPLGSPCVLIDVSLRREFVFYKLYMMVHYRSSLISPPFIIDGRNLYFSSQKIITICQWALSTKILQFFFIYIVTRLGNHICLNCGRHALIWPTTFLLVANNCLLFRIVNYVWDWIQNTNTTWKYIYTNKNLLYSLKLPTNSGAPVSFPFHREFMLFACVIWLYFLNVDVRFLFPGIYI